MGSFRNHLLFWVGVIAGASVAVWLAAISARVGGSAKPLTVYPGMLVAGLLAFVASSLLLWATVMRSGASRPYFGAGSAFLLMVALGGMLASFAPGHSVVGMRDLLHERSAPAAPRTFGVPILFTNGSDRISAEELLILHRVVDVFSDCTNPQVIVRGYASSARFRENSDLENLKLSNRRARNVADALTKRGFSVVQTPWAAYEEMTGERRIRDISTDGDRDVEKEARNRRVEILWRDSPCFAPVAARASSASAPVRPFL